MKKTFPFFIAIIAVALLSGCAKERDNYDKFLTTGTWTLSSATQEQKSVTNYNYIALATPDRTETSENNTTIADGKSTNIGFSQTALSPGTTTFTRQTQKGNLSWTMKFNKDGTYELTRTSQRLSSQTDTHIGNGPVTNITESAETSTQTGMWSWQNNTDTKQTLLIESFGVALNVDISKNSLALSYKQTSTSTGRGSDGLGQYDETSSSDANLVFNFSK
jgi:hypothetical protein